MQCATEMQTLIKIFSFEKTLSNISDLHRLNALEHRGRQKGHLFIPIAIYTEHCCSLRMILFLILLVGWQC